MYIINVIFRSHFIASQFSALPMIKRRHNGSLFLSFFGIVGLATEMKVTPSFSVSFVLHWNVGQKMLMLWCVYEPLSAANFPEQEYTIRTLWCATSQNINTEAASIKMGHHETNGSIIGTAKRFKVIFAQAPFALGDAWCMSWSNES